MKIWKYVYAINEMSTILLHYLFRHFNYCIFPTCSLLYIIWCLLLSKTGLTEYMIPTKYLKHFWRYFTCVALLTFRNDLKVKFYQILRWKFYWFDITYSYVNIWGCGQNSRVEGSQEALSTRNLVQIGVLLRKLESERTDRQTDTTSTSSNEVHEASEIKIHRFSKSKLCVILIFSVFSPLLCLRIYDIDCYRIYYEKNGEFGTNTYLNIMIVKMMIPCQLFVHKLSYSDHISFIITNRYGQNTEYGTTATPCLRVFWESIVLSWKISFISV